MTNKKTINNIDDYFFFGFPKPQSLDEQIELKNILQEGFQKNAGCVALWKEYVRLSGDTRFAQFINSKPEGWSFKDMTKDDETTIEFFFSLYFKYIYIPLYSEFFEREKLKCKEYFNQLKEERYDDTTN